MNKYNKGKIYKITSPNTEEVYYGSTILSLKHRFRSHTKNNDDRSYSKKIIEYGDAKIELIENYPCETKQELLWRERYYFDNFECVNKMKPIQSKEEEREYQKKIRKEYYKKNKERIKIQTQNYRNENKEKVELCGNKYKEIKLSCRVCKLEMIKHSFTRHEKTKRHLENIKMKQEMRSTGI